MIGGSGGRWWGKKSSWVVWREEQGAEIRKSEAEEELGMGMGPRECCHIPIR